MKSSFLGKKRKTMFGVSKHSLMEDPCLLLALSLMLSAAAAAAADDAKPGCTSSCGDLTVPYPFGIGDGCFLEGFGITCNDSNGQSKPFLGVYEVVNISLAQNQLSIKNHVAHMDWGINVTDVVLASINLTDTPFAFSKTANKFTVTGCNSFGVFQLGKGADLGGCLSVCSKSNNQTDSAEKNNEPCSGFGCCQTSIISGVKSFGTGVLNIFNESTIKELLNESETTAPAYQCGYAFLVDTSSYAFESLSDLDQCSSSKIENSSVILDWLIGNQTCAEAEKNSETYACKENSKCEEHPDTGGTGYRCSCKQGYHGNPYLSPGCQDIDECKNTNNPCQGKGTCSNLIGSYDCICPPGTYRDGSNCSKSSGFPLIPFVLGFSGLLVLLLSFPSIYFFLKRRKLIKLREKYFRENGGLLLQQQNPFRQSAVETNKIFTTKELEKATDNYSANRIIGEGGNGMVYQGVVHGGKTVAVKKSKIVDKTQIDQFINEVVVLTQINHRNVVKLLGCCLETQVPLLVYEFVPNGSLHYHIHNRLGSISWDVRLRIAMETASALSYLHSAASVPIIHRDVKSANILLDENYIAKVSDFGASRLIPVDQTQINTLVQGTLGYLDPEYFQTSQLTEKSDVYSYGVLLVELLTGEMPISFARPEPQRNLSSYFILSMRHNRLFEIIEPGLGNQNNGEELKAIADLAMRCLRLKGDERPTMKEVAMELTGLRKFEQHPWDQANPEGLSLLDERSSELHPTGLAFSVYLP
ncbi:hypothetical protein DITRI_Ditri06bG0005600 [Diplodiscus trichospermus]